MKNELYVYNIQRIKDCKKSIVKNLILSIGYISLVKDIAINLFIDNYDLIESDYIYCSFLSTFAAPLILSSFHILGNVSKISTLEDIQKEIREENKVFIKRGDK